MSANPRPRAVVPQFASYPADELWPQQLTWQLPSPCELPEAQEHFLFHPLCWHPLMLAFAAGFGYTFYEYVLVHESASFTAARWVWLRLLGAVFDSGAAPA